MRKVYENARAVKASIAKGKTITLVGGSFDLLHVGHLHLRRDFPQLVLAFGQGQGQQTDAHNETQQSLHGSFSLADSITGGYALGESL